MKYLTLVEQSNGNFELGNVFLKSGGWDSIKALALSEARVHHPKTSFRAHGGNPEKLDDDVVTPKPGDVVRNVSGFSSNSKVGCVAWNTGKSHLFKHVEEGTRRCKFNHACDKILDEKDANGRPLHCLGAHKRDACDNPKRKQ